MFHSGVRGSLELIINEMKHETSTVVSLWLLRLWMINQWLAETETRVQGIPSEIPCTLGGWEGTGADRKEIINY